ncbi:hypothetical protein KFE25_004264 [Diacronema lutheri]|uniref:DUF7870 domain-containing protein n=1 Tax=Diacronema lutheri TaxID=2081491 RepID=A0A8J6C6D2_DIALT|nr:hypothetical protein KFE25_004264 [Diacronema lutheri]
MGGNLFGALLLGCGVGRAVRPAPCVPHEVPWRSTCAWRYTHLFERHEGFSLLAAGESCQQRRASVSLGLRCRGSAQLQAETRRRKASVNAHLLGNMLPSWPARADGARNVYIDLGANAIYKSYPLQAGGEQWERTGSVGWFLSTYPNASLFDVIAFEPNLAHRESHARVSNAVRVARLEYHAAAVGVRNDTAFLVSRDKSHDLSHQWGSRLGPSRSFGKSLSVPMIDFVEFLNRHIRPSDFVTVKMDVENGEWELLPSMLLPGGNVTLIDELFFECHHRETPSIVSAHGYTDCLHMMRELMRAGVWVHEWF